MNDIVDLLASDHESINRQMAEAEGESAPEKKRVRMMRLFEHLLTHEKIEGRLLVAISNIERDESVEKLAEDFHQLHESLWILLEVALNAFNSEGDAMDRAFSDLCSIAKVHMMIEDGIFFPKIRARLAAGDRIALEEYAAREMERSSAAAPRTDLAGAAR